MWSFAHFSSSMVWVLKRHSRSPRCDLSVEFELAEEARPRPHQSKYSPRMSCAVNSEISLGAQSRRLRTRYFEGWADEQ